MRIVFALAAAPAMLAAQAPDTSRAPGDTARTLETVTVSAIRSRADAPVSASLLLRPEIERRSIGQDIPLLLQGAPSLTSYAETGGYWGYSYMRLRGIDQSRINLTLDGIPLNDPEDQVLYFADFPDLANSIASIQVQRGVGTSAPGTASYGGSINFQTIPLFSSTRSTEAQLQGGSFGSSRASVEHSTGPVAGGRFATYARLSALRSNGYRETSGMEGRSAFLSAAYLGERDMLKLTAVAGLFRDTLSYLGATRAEIAVDRRYNPLRPDETDRFGEQVLALAYTRQLRTASSLATTVYRISADGNYDVCISACDQPQGDLWNFHLDFAWYGATSVWSLDRDRSRISVGVNGNTYERDHFAFARPQLDQPLYRNTGHKDDASVFAKVAHDVGRWTLFADVQARVARFAYEPDANAGIAESAIDWRFINPKAGITWRIRDGIESYASFGVNTREPARADMLAGFDNLDTSNVAFVGPLTRVKPERARDLEAGLRWQASRWSLAANGFAMGFSNEILPVGELTYIGTPLRKNVRSSWRRGVEAEATLKALDNLEMALSATVMRGHIDEYTDDASGRTFRDVEPLLTPRVTAAQRVSVGLPGNVRLTLGGQYVGASQLDNTGDATLTLPASYIANAHVEWTRSPFTLGVHLNNLADARQFGSGHVSFGEARYYVLPPRNLFVQARVGLF